MRTVQRKTISLILLFIVSTMLIGIFSACDGIGDYAENDAYSISRSELKDINTAWSERWGEGSVFAESCDDIKYRVRGHSTLYIKYSDCIVLFQQLDSLFYGETTVSKYTFKLPSCRLWVCKDSTYYTLKEAYENGILTDEQIAEIAEIHADILDVDIERED